MSSSNGYVRTMKVLHSSVYLVHEETETLHFYSLLSGMFEGIFSANCLGLEGTKQYMLERLGRRIACYFHLC